MQNIVIIDKAQETLSYQKSVLILDGYKIPLRMIDFLLIPGSIHIRGGVLPALSEQGIPVLIFNDKHHRMSLITPLHAKNADLKLDQYRALDDRVMLAKQMIKNKLSAHADHLQKHDLSIEIEKYLTALDRTQTISEAMGIEGSFAHRYFEAYFKWFPRHLTKGMRTKQPPQDPVNAMLSWLYTLLYFQIAARLVIQGFEPAIGYLHTPFRDHFALASDILESQRAAVNELVFELFNSAKLTQEDFTNKAGVYLKTTARAGLWAEIKPFMHEREKEIQSQIAYLRSEIRKCAA